MTLPTPQLLKEILLEHSMRKILGSQAASKGRKYCTWWYLDNADPELIAARGRYEGVEDRELSIRTAGAFKQEGMVAEVERLIDKDTLAPLTWQLISPKDDVRTKIQKKAHELAMKILDNLYPVGEDTQQRGEGFTCYVTVLTKGWVEVQKKTQLFFEYKDNFAYFLEQLQDTTRRCLIPPRILQATADENMAALQNQLGKGDFSVKVDQNNTDACIFRQRDANESGYTLLDGYWTYRLVQPNIFDGADRPAYYPAKLLGNESQFDFMKAELVQSEKDIKVYQQIEWDNRDEIIRTIKNDARGQGPQVAAMIRHTMGLQKYQKRTTHVILTHSTDKLAIEKYEHQKAAERKEEQRFQQAWQSDIAHNDHGERYTDMMNRVFVQQRKAWDLGGLKAAVAADLLTRTTRSADALSLRPSPAVTSSPAPERESIHRMSSGLGGSSTEGASSSEAQSKEESPN